MTKAKPFDISKREVWEAFKKVKANQGAAGVDGQSIGEFEANLADNLYKLWNRLSSGSYLPPPVRRVDIPKAKGGTRPLGIPTVADRIAQEVVRRLRSYYDGVRLLVAVHHRLRLLAFPMRTAAPSTNRHDGGQPRDLPGSGAILLP